MAGSRKFSRKVPISEEAEDERQPGHERRKGNETLITDADSVDRSIGTQLGPQRSRPHKKQAPT